ncbi:VPLPA-CTERM sorting domain-containing protein [Jannaschia sp. LMIT008]|uniref:VPLPA-CTERM sorting domain-containing protein n=1 Tax=Jannaschia maritima TaxID=3032585 RepID=UPI002811AF4A|nr:VPLPA-CTERM sorting domain-containing protein [Jannaschia sp. LMIT008]
MRTFTTTALALTLVAGTFAAAPHAADAATLTSADQPTFTGDAATRFRSFNNTGGQEVYVGSGNLGSPSNRNAAEYNWAPGSYDFSFTVDLANDVLTTTLPGLAPLTRAFTSDDAINAFRISVVDRDANGEVWLSDLSVNGESLGDVTDANDEGFQTFFVTGLASASTYSVTGTLNLSGSFGNSQERSKLDIVAGATDLPPVPVPAALPLLLAGLGGIAALGRRKAA